MTVVFRFAAGAVGALHSQPHVQATYVQPGRFAVTVDGKDLRVGPGDSFVIPSGAVHGCRCFDSGVLLDSFTPRRDDFL